MREHEVWKQKQETFLDDILGPKTAGEAHFDGLPKQGTQEWLDAVSNSAWYRGQTGTKVGRLSTLSIGGGSEATDTETVWEKDPFFDPVGDEDVAS